MDRTLKGRLALITGASRGIGRAIALRLAAAGADIVVHFNSSEEKAAEVVAEAMKLDVQATAVQADLASPSAVRALAEQIRQLGDISILVNNAGITRDVPFRSVEDDFQERVFAVNFNAPRILAQEFSRKMMKAGWGRLINITSMVGQTGGKALSAYAASKAALAAWTKSVAKEIGTKGVTVNAVAPGFIKTDMMEDAIGGQVLIDHLISACPIGRIGKPEEVAGIVAFLCSDEAGFITGQEIGVNGGLHC